MNAMMLIASVLAGFFLGGFYFGGLWWTVRRLPQSEMAGLWLLASFVFRMAVVLTGFFLVSDGHWDRILACLVGFIIARTVIVKFSNGFNDLRSECRQDFREITDKTKLLTSSATVFCSKKTGRGQNGNR